MTLLHHTRQRLAQVRKRLLLLSHHLCHHKVDTWSESGICMHICIFCDVQAYVTALQVFNCLLHFIPLLHHVHARDLSVRLV